jgi:hypothetical protein
MIRTRTQIFAVATIATLLIIIVGYLFDALDKLERWGR